MRDLGEERTRIHLILDFFELLNDFANVVAFDALHDEFTVMQSVFIHVVSPRLQLFMNEAEEATNVLPLIVQESQVLAV